VNSGNEYVFNSIKFNVLVDILTSKKEINQIFSDMLDKKSDSDIKKEDIGNYLYPMDYKIDVINMNTVHKV